MQSQVEDFLSFQNCDIEIRVKKNVVEIGYFNKYELTLSGIFILWEMLEFRLTVSINAEKRKQKISLKMEQNCIINGKCVPNSMKREDGKPWSARLHFYAWGLILLIILTNLHILNENKDFDMTVKIVRDSSSVLLYLAVYTYHFYEDTEFTPNLHLT